MGLFTRNDFSIAIKPDDTHQLKCSVGICAHSLEDVSPFEATGKASDSKYGADVRAVVSSRKGLNGDALFISRNGRRWLIGRGSATLGVQRAKSAAVSVAVT